MAVLYTSLSVDTTEYDVHPNTVVVLLEFRAPELELELVDTLKCILFFIVKLYSEIGLICRAKAKNFNANNLPYGRVLTAVNV